MGDKAQGKPRNRKSTKKKLRDTAVRQMALEGHTNREIGDAVGLTESHVSRILNDDETKDLIRQSENALKLMITEALKTHQDAMTGRHEFQQMGHALRAASEVFNRVLGKVSEKVELNVIKPTVIERRDGSEVVMGISTKEEGEE